MRHFSIFSAAILFAAMLFLCSSNASAQGVVQLPTFRVFGTNTTVVVPDGGTAFLGGSTGSYSGSNQSGFPGFGVSPFFGPLGQNRGIGGGGSVGSISATAWIHDQEAMDTAILGATVDEIQRNARRQQTINAQLSQNPTQVAIPLVVQRNSSHGNPDSQPIVLRSSSTDQGPLLSVAEIKRRKALEQLQRSQQELSQQQSGNSNRR